MEKRTPNVVHAVVITGPDDDYSRIGIEVWSDDGEDLTSQQILDAVSDALLDHIALSDEGDEPDPRYDA